MLRFTHADTRTRDSPPQPPPKKKISKQITKYVTGSRCICMDLLRRVSRRNGSSVETLLSWGVEVNAAIVPVGACPLQDAPVYAGVDEEMWEMGRRRTTLPDECSKLPTWSSQSTPAIHSRTVCLFHQPECLASLKARSCAYVGKIDRI